VNHINAEPDIYKTDTLNAP